MKVIDHLEKAKGPLLSFEIVPPPRGTSIHEIIEIADVLAALKPSWIDVTSHASSAIFNENPDGTFQKKIYRKRPGTLGICGIIQNRFKIDTVAHVLCQGFTREETEDALIELNFLGIQNVLALKGDSQNFQKEVSKNRTVNHYASDLVEQITDLKKGIFLEDISGSSPLDFCVGVAGYPEKHFESANLKLDLHNLKNKVQAGADYIVTQMFFDNKKYFEFVRACREIGITVPIIPGLKILRTKNQLQTIPKTFHIDLPDELVEEVLLESSESISEIGKRWALKQAQELLESNTPGLHFYIMNDTKDVAEIVKKLF